MSEMEFSWRMVATLVWPLVVLTGLIVYRKWITKTLTSLTFKFGSVEVALNTKVDTTGQDIATALLEMKERTADDEIASLVDLMPVVCRNMGKASRPRSTGYARRSRNTIRSWAAFRGHRYRKKWINS